MKILLVNKFHYLRGGSETYYFGLAELLRKQGHEVIFFSMHDSKNIPCKQEKYFVSHVEYNQNNYGVNKFKIGVNTIYSREAHDKFEQLVLDERPDVVHIGLVHRQITLSILDVIRKYKIPCVYTVHDLIWICPCYMMLSSNGVCRKCINGHYSNCISQKCIKNSFSKSTLGVLEAKFIRYKKYSDDIDIYITECDLYKKLLMKSRFSHSPVIHMVNFLALDKTYEAHINNSKEHYLLYFGRFSKEKGILTLIEAYAKTEVRNPLYIVGGGPQKEEIEKAIDRNNKDGRIKLIQPTYGKEMEKIIINSRAVIVPSEWDENCPYSMMEAMAKGTPIIASRIGGLPELIDDRKSGYLFTAGDSNELVNCINNICNLPPQRYESMCNCSLENAKAKFDSTLYMDKLVSIYRELIKKKEGPNYG